MNVNASESGPAARRGRASLFDAMDDKIGNGNRVIEIERELITLFGDLCVALGLPRSYGQIYGVAFASVDPVCFDDVVARIGLSKGSASQGIRWLREVGALHLLRDHRALRRSERGAVPRRDYFVPETSRSALIRAIVRERVQSPFHSGESRLSRLDELLAEAQPSSSRRSSGNALGLRARGKKRMTRKEIDQASVRSVAHLRKRIESLWNWHRRAQNVVSFLIKLSD